jgi:predicted nucleic acid-binding protein
VDEPGSAWVRTIVGSTPDHVISIADLTRAEVASALARRAREGSITSDESRELIRAFQAHCMTQYRLVPAEHILIDLAIDLLQHHALRAYDAVQLATAILVHRSLLGFGLPGPIFISADDDLLVAAQAEGLAVDNPNRHP